jgi:hypothetical protein
MDALFDSIDLERETRFKKPWTKLDKGSRLNRISLFIKMEKQTRDLNDMEETKLKILLSQIYELGCLNKSSVVTYNEEDPSITHIKHLEFDIDTKMYSFVKEEKKAKSTEKSKSNIDRHFSRSKESKR